MKEYFLRTERIGFSMWRKADLDLAMLLWGQPEVTQFICANSIFTDEEIKKRLELEIKNEELYQVQYYPIFDLNNSNLIGCCGLRPYKSEVGVYEIGFHLRKEYWHQGLANEAAKAIINYAFLKLNAKALMAGHHPNNDGSKKLLFKLGFEYMKDSYYEPTGLNHPSYMLKNSHYHYRNQE